ncbi:proteasome beta subunit, putative [Entamoeba histolytica KU27]|uniref:Proteasome beta subunit, putative n=1 Tax=Entamoeba histolytica KU27 TaxID=885311 RepID=M2RZK3_ENTHI|nr:proteasome beta subunit, putative [Entamoeba histolytica KU27]
MGKNKMFTQQPVREAKNNQWSPYEDNCGTCVVIKGEDFVVIASDTRMSRDYMILTRNDSKIYPLTSKCVFTGSGMRADIKELTDQIKAHIKNYKYENGKEMSTESVAQVLSNTLYSHRFFPYYSFSLLAGINSKGKAVTYNYDAVGSFEERKYSCSGSGEELAYPLLDSLLKDRTEPLGEQEAINIARDVMTSACERDIHTGDNVEIVILNSNGIRKEVHFMASD